METKDFYYDLPEELIAQHPIDKRDESRLMVLDRKTGKVEHMIFHDIINLLHEGDVLVANDSKVIPARLFGNRSGKEEKIEVLLISQTEEDTWKTLVKPGKKMKIGSEIEFGHGLLRAVVVDIDDDGVRYIKFKYDGIFLEILNELGKMPLPPYIKERLEDKDRYQTVYAKNLGSAAAPTAGLHFTKELLKELEDKGVKIVYLTLHVGLGTFRPVKVTDVEKHKMHSEFYNLSEEASETINKAKKEGRRVIAVGTTTVRTLETIAAKGEIKASHGWTDIFIYPGFEYKAVDALITNFHLPESTLIMLVSAFASKEMILNAYAEAVKERYRFFSFGDAMFILDR